MDMMRTKTIRSLAFRPRGFTLTELMIGMSVMLIIIVATLSLYSRSNKVAVDHNQLAEVQQDVRSGMYLIARDVRMAGVGIPLEFITYFLEGIDNESQGQGGGAEVLPDRLRLMGNLDDPLDLIIQNYQGSSINLSLEDLSFEQNPYPDSYYDNKFVLILPNPASACRSGEVRSITQVTRSAGGTNERLNFSPGLAPGVNLPGGLSGTCSSSNDYDGGFVTFINVKEYWLDLTGNYPGLPAGQNGYIGNGNAGILYMTQNGYHFPMAQNIENLQFEYNGDLDNDQALDGFRPWQIGWTPIEVSRIRQVRIFILGRTEQPFLTVGNSTLPPQNYSYRRPAVSNNAVSAANDRHKRFLLESTSSIRNMSLNLYNMGTR